MWFSMHRVSLTYPREQPTDKDRTAARQFFESVGSLLPCPSCRVHYMKHFVATFTDETTANREALSRWVYDLHEAVNKRLGVVSGVKFEDLPQLVNSFPTRYVDLDTGDVLTRARFVDQGGVSQPSEKEARTWLVDNLGHGLDDRSAFEKLFQPIGEKQTEFARRLILFSLLFLVALLTAVLLFTCSRGRKNTSSNVPPPSVSVTDANVGAKPLRTT